MYYKFSKLAKFAILFSAVLTAAVILIHIYNIYRIVETNNLIFDMMAEKNVLRETAIRYLEDEGHDLFIGGEFTTFSSVVLGILALITLSRYSKNNSFSFAILASFFCLFTSFISGLLLFYVIFSGKSEQQVASGERVFHNQWERYISKKSSENIRKQKNGTL